MNSRNPTRRDTQRTTHRICRRILHTVLRNPAHRVTRWLSRSQPKPNYLSLALAAIRAVERLNRLHHPKPKKKRFQPLLTPQESARRCHEDLLRIYGSDE